ncbi:MAG: urease accessory protein UreE [Pseudomonadota bacterium]|nr:urease accessory protein UreE [Pseudomonadota bacterium]
MAAQPASVAAAPRVVLSARTSHGVVTATLTLPFAQRCKSRLRCRLDNGAEAAVLIARGGVLRNGDLLAGDDGRVVQVVAATEPLSQVETGDLKRLAQICYHLGNRHVTLQIGPGWVRYARDHVLDEMVRRFGCKVRHVVATFEPEIGAYHQHGHGARVQQHHAHQHGADHGD